ncbi:putative periplasmic protein [Desulfocapsa sulfexigens DSM 10523]|uniref:Putative periplasmic protein n=1 Tax=Desulfocapsa sulfexigens (strain DSM 10523 / SB164P1) TaxID=1167006 RepID=M1P9G2_DESSD|nr:transglutaminase-like cysteine peptidase [Desulfocapsa sulfexigens]AGF78297.1 putative periplasmic protein [Desulfocapsa sulfexigens DSM 10523]
MDGQFEDRIYCIPLYFRDLLMIDGNGLLQSRSSNRYGAIVLNSVNAPLTIIQLVLSRSSSVLKFANNTLLPFAFVFLLFFFAGQIASANEIFTLDSSLLDTAEDKYGVDARKRLLAWQQFVREDTSRTDIEKLEKVNRFFNQLNFVSDAIHWSKKDYWATPVEFLASDGGDCEDFALSKYFTLKMLGVPEKKLTLTYVKAWKLNQSHMVLTYYKTPTAVPLVLDNLINAIKPATQRSDLLPVYSFNGAGLWLAKERGRGDLVGKSDRLKLWNDLLERMPASIQ